MKYKKQALTYETQADILLNRGLVADRATLIERLSMVNYYRLSAYWYPFRIPNSIWTTPILVKGNQTFGILTILKFLMQQVAPKSKWSNRLIALFNAHPEISLSCMGFPDNWMDSPIWNNQPQVKHDTD